ncbi:hypothetical protein PV326_006181 [Microctonus aethiopoides]|nr:hypothetical protein PV326_006181 [Microctonus aethiopoides]
MSEKYEYEMKNNQQTNESVIFYPNNFGRFKRSPTLKTLTLKVKINGKSKIIKLTATNQILANDYLPVWISSNKQNEVYQKLHNVMLEDVEKLPDFHVSENKWGFMKKSHSYIEANKINDDIDEYFRTREKYFPRHSFDYVAYNTRENIVTSTKISVLGISTSSGYEPIFYPHEYPYRYNFAVKDSESYEHYTTIAHELAHVFNAGHDKIMNWFFIHPCERSVMAAVDCSSSYCLKWSDKTENDFKKFFNSPAHCILRNKPQSLIPSWQKQLRLTKLQQCVCYGYKSHYEVDKEYFIKDMCGRNIMCKNDQDQVITNLPYPMNGTPCGKNKVSKFFHLVLC